MNAEKIAKWKSLVEKAPNDELARFTLARAYLEAGQLEAARTTFREVVALKPDWMMAWILLGRCCVELGDGAEGRPALATARELANAQGHSDPLVEIDELLEQLG
jgi:Flp pilus assembly protein TadD